jgi:drug/metabolite transporter (DMT)-like permease
LTFTALCFGANTTLAKLAVGEVSPMMVVTLRWLIVVGLLVAFNKKSLARDWPSLKPHLGFLFVMGAFGFSVFNGLFFIAAQYTSAINMGIITAMMPVFVLVGALLLYRTPTRKLQWVGALVTLLGVLVVASDGEIERLLQLRLNTGDLILVVATIIYAAYTVGLRRRPNSSALGLFTVLAASAFLASLPMLVAETLLGRVQVPTTQGWGLVVLVSLFPTLIAQILFIRGVEIIGPGRAGIFVNLVPVFGTVIAVLYLGEKFQFFHGLALALVLGGLWLAERGAVPGPVEKGGGS